MARNPLLVVILFLVTPQSPAQDTVVFNTPGNLEATMPLGCVDLDQLSNSHSPADMFHGVWACVQQEDYEKAIDLLLVARAYGFYDIDRVRDSSAHGAVQMLQIRIADAMDDAQHAAWAAVSESRQDMDLDQGPVCSRLMSLGPPDYFPYYMVQHGLRASVPPDTGNALREDFAPDRAWTTVLENYECIEARPVEPAEGVAIEAEAAPLTAAEQVTLGLNHSATYLVAVSEMFMATGQWPESNADAGMNDPEWQEGFRISIGPEAVVTVEFDSPEELRGRTLVRIPGRGEYGLDWTCSSDTIPPELLPESCRD